MAEDCDEFLNLMAIADAYHDFGTKIVDDDIILKGLHCKSKPELEKDLEKNPENYILKRIIGYDDVNALEYDLKEDPEFKKNIKTINGNKYTVKVLYTEVTSRGGIKNKNTSIKSKGFCDNVDIGDLQNFFMDNGKKTFLIDTDGIRFLNIFEHAYNKDTANVCSRIINRELLNDSAPKATSHLKKVGDLNDFDDNITKYNNRRFNTSYKITLGSILGLNSGFKIKKNGELLYESNDSNENNKPNCVIKINKAKREHDIEKQSALYQVKRSGDWLQALSILNTEREYNGDTKLDGNDILITFDIILVCYCLYLGINVILTRRNSGEAYFFKCDKRIIKVSNSIISEALPLAEVVPSVPLVPFQPEVVGPPDVNSPLNLTNENFSKNFDKLINIEKRWDTRKKRKVTTYSADELYKVEVRELLKSSRKLRKLIKGIISKAKPEGMNQHIYDKLKNTVAKNLSLMEGGKSKSRELCQQYITKLSKDLECFDNEGNSDYDYYEKVAFIMLSCLNEYKGSRNVYEQMQAIAFDILPSIEGYIKCEEPDIVQFFSGDQYTADCTSYAARNIALHTLELRTGTIESLGNREKYSVKIPSSAVDFYKKIEKHLEKSTFEERRDWLIEQLEAYNKHLKLNSHKKSSTRKVSSGIKMSKHKLITAGGKRKTCKSRQ
jgi:hypothetical protein